MPDCDSSDNIYKDMVNKNYNDCKGFNLDVSRGLSMKGNKVINVADPKSATDGSSKKYVNTKTSTYLNTGGTRVMTGNLNINSRSIINVKPAQSHESTNAANVNFVNTTVNESNIMITSHHMKYVNDRLNHSVGSTDQKNVFQYLIYLVMKIM